MADTSADAGVNKCAKGLVLLEVLGLRAGESRKKIAKQDDVYIKDASRTLRLTTDMPLVPRFDIFHKSVSG